MKELPPMKLYVTYTSPYALSVLPQKS